MALHPELPSEMSLSKLFPHCKGPRKSDCSSSENDFSECFVRMDQKLGKPSSKARAACASHIQKEMQSVHTGESSEGAHTSRRVQTLSFYFYIHNLRLIYPWKSS